MATIFDNLINLTDQLRVEDYGDWIYTESGQRIILPFPVYKENIHKLLHEVMAFHQDHPEYELAAYASILEYRGVAWSKEAMENADVSQFDAQGILGLLMGMIRAERFCDGVVMYLCECGAVVRWLERLQVIAQEME